MSDKISKVKVNITLEKFFALMSRYVDQSIRDDLINIIKKEGFMFNGTYYTVYDVKKHLSNLESKLRLEQWKIMGGK